MTRTIQDNLNEIIKAFEIYNQVQQTPSYRHVFEKDELKQYPNIYHCAKKHKIFKDRMYFEWDSELNVMVHSCFDEVVHYYENKQLKQEQIDIINHYYASWYGEFLDD